MLDIVLIVVFILIGGVFAAAEMALVSLRESQIRALSQQGQKFTITTPPFLATSERMSSGTLRGWSTSARADEWENMTGASVTASAARMVSGAT